MKRLVLIGCIGSAAILPGFAACGKAPVPGDCDPDNLTTAPQACPDRQSLGFAREFGSGTWIGSKPQESIVVYNYGTDDLRVDAVSLSGDSAFKLDTAPSMLPANIPGNKFLAMRVTFAPTEAKLYTGRITLQSNAANGAALEFEVSGCGVPSDGGTSPCYRDGGVAP